MFGSSVSSNDIVAKTEKHLVACFGATESEIFEKITASSGSVLKQDCEIMLKELKQWSNEHDLGMWKRSAIIGAIEMHIINWLPKDVCKDYMRLTRSVINQ